MIDLLITALKMPESRLEVGPPAVGGHQQLAADLGHQLGQRPPARAHRDGDHVARAHGALVVPEHRGGPKVGARELVEVHHPVQALGHPAQTDTTFFCLVLKKKSREFGGKLIKRIWLYEILNFFYFLNWILVEFFKERFFWDKN
jgi:hypothetical protein